MRYLMQLLVVLLLAAAATGVYLARSLFAPHADETKGLSTGPGIGEADAFVVSGKTVPAPGHSASIAPTVLHPVIEVLVKAGDRVKKDQELVKLDADEPKADLEGKQAAVQEMKASLARLRAEPRQEEQNEALAALSVAQVSHEAAQRLLERLTPAYERGAVPEQRYHDARVGVAKSKAEQQAASARLERLRKRPFLQEVAELEAKIKTAEAAVKASAAELEHYTVVAPIGGHVSWLDVNPGTVSRPGTTLWGEIVDPSVLDVRCDVSPQQADRLRVGQPAEVYPNGDHGPRLTGTVAVVGIAGDRATGRVPVLVRLPNPEQRLRSHVEVQVHFGGAKAYTVGR
jgi:multidrug resistance efflux pump